MNSIQAEGHRDKFVGSVSSIQVSQTHGVEKPPPHFVLSLTQTTRDLSVNRVSARAIRISMNYARARTKGRLVTSDEKLPVIVAWGTSWLPRAVLAERSAQNARLKRQLSRRKIRAQNLAQYLRAELRLCTGRGSSPFVGVRGQSLHPGKSPRRNQNHCNTAIVEIRLLEVCFRFTTPASSAGARASTFLAPDYEYRTRRALFGTITCITPGSSPITSISNPETSPNHPLKTKGSALRMFEYGKHTGLGARRTTRKQRRNYSVKNERRGFVHVQVSRLGSSH